MHLTEDQVTDLGIALNEAELVGVQFEPQQRVAAVTVSVLALPADNGPPPADARVQLLLHPIGRIAASLRHGHADDPSAQVEPFEVHRIGEAVASFDQQPISGWTFFDVPENEGFAGWANRLSLDWRSAPGGMSHTLDLFQAGDTSRHLDLRLWFDEMGVFGPDGRRIQLDDFTAAGLRWWEGLFAGDQRTASSGIVAEGDWPRGA